MTMMLLRVKFKPLFRQQPVKRLYAFYTMPKLRERLKSVGARWVPEGRLWRVRYGLIRGDKELEERIMKG